MPSALRIKEIRDLEDNVMMQNGALTENVSLANIADDSISGDKIHGGTMSGSPMLTFGGTSSMIHSGTSYLYQTMRSTITSTTNTTWRSMWSFTINTTAYNYLNNSGNAMGIAFESFITSGSYWYTWRLYNTRTADYVPLLQTSTPVNNYLASGGGISYRGSVHVMSGQPIVYFDTSNFQDGDTLQLQMSPSTGGGSDLYSATQQLNFRFGKAWIGMGSTYLGGAYWDT